MPENSAACRAAGRTRRPAKVRFIRLRQHPREILDAARPQEGEYRPRSIKAFSASRPKVYIPDQNLIQTRPNWANRSGTPISPASQPTAEKNQPLIRDCQSRAKSRMNPYGAKSR